MTKALHSTMYKHVKSLKHQNLVSLSNSTLIAVCRVSERQADRLWKPLRQCSLTMVKAWDNNVFSAVVWRKKDYTPSCVCVCVCVCVCGGGGSVLPVSVCGCFRGKQHIERQCTDIYKETPIVCMQKLLMNHKSWCIYSNHESGITHKNHKLWLRGCEKLRAYRE